MFKEKVATLLQEALDENPSLFLIDFSIEGANQIRITIDGDSGVTVEDCMAVSRKIEHNIDREEVDFSLDVLSVGATTPLTMARQYVKNVGRTLEVTTVQGETIEGLLEDATSDDIILTWKAREPKPVGKGKVTVAKEKTVAYDDIKEAKVIIKF